MIYRSKIILLAIVLGFVFLFLACDDQPQEANKPAPSVISRKISSQPLSQNKIEKDELNTKNNEVLVKESGLQALELKKDQQEIEHYDFQGKIDPFESLIQEKQVEVMPQVDERPKRILTPLEKIGLNQIRLVAVIIMKNRQIAMVEEANGKGYEVGIGTYIGKNQGKVYEIKDSSIVIKERVKDYKGRLKERVQEIKLHKIDNEE
ncbi:MAG: pilus assembly protein PilP [Desulfobacula sp.]|jgi:type IV pilus assembly protein PilP|nr:pilus assembly protein PilP [Desulfobacula sp.]